MPQLYSAPLVVRQIVLIEYYEHPSRGRVPVHVHPFCKLEMVLSGQVKMVTDTYGALTLRRGDAAFIPAFTAHGYEPRARMRHVAIKFHAHPRYWVATGRRVRKIRLTAPLLKVARDVGEASIMTDRMAPALAVAAATYCATWILRSLIQSDVEPVNNEGDDRFWPILYAVTDHPLKPWTVRELAASCHLSESHFTNRFTRAFGLSPQRFLLDTRMAAATDLLLASSGSIKHIAQEAGYANVHGFTRAFTRATGNPPAEFRRLHRLHAKVPAAP